MYFIVSNSDGDTNVESVSKEELIKRLDEQYYGEVEFLNEIEDEDTNYWGDSILIIKGEIAVPTPKKVIETYEI